MKKILTIVLSCAILNVCASVKPRNPIFRVVQTDGTELTVHHVGNGDFSAYQTVDGYCVALDSNGDYRYVERVEVDGSFVLASALAHNPSDRSTDEVRSVSSYVKTRDYANINSKVRETVLPNQSVKKVGLASTAPLPSVGSPKIPIILVQFSDLKFSVSENEDSVRSFFDKFCNGTNSGVNYTGGGSFGSVKDYFIAQSDSLFQPCFDVIGPVTLPNSYVYYGKDSNYSKDVNIYSFYQESIQMAQSLQNDWNQFDNDSDGVIDMVYFVYAGEGQNGSDDTNTIWPKEQGSGGTIGGVKYGSYGCSNETYNGSVDGIGTICHELSHALGLPDLYDTNYVAFGMDYWDVMDSGNYCADGKRPCGYSAYEKDFMGWKKLVELDPENPQTLTLIPLSEGGGGYKIINKENPNEYYVLDNRQNTNWDLNVGYSTERYGKAHGMLVTHIDYSQSSWTSNKVNTSKNHQRLTLIPADGELLIRNANNTAAYLLSMQGDPYPGCQEVTCLKDDKAVVYAGGTMNQPITNIVEKEDGTITFDYCLDGDENAIVGIDDVADFLVEGNVIMADEELKVYDLAGVLVARLQKQDSAILNGGIYIVHSKEKVQKILIRE